MIKKVLFCATVDYHFKAFHLPYLKWFKDKGWEVHVAANGTMELPFTDKKYTLPIQRSPFSVGNITAYKELKQIINANKYEIIHCHTPLGGVISRLAARKERKQGCKVIYTAHGFHFCKGAPLKNWIIYYPIEKLLAHFTDCLLTINEEDYNLAKKKLRATSIQHVHGVGVDTEKFKPISKKEKLTLRESLGYKEEDVVLFYAAEFNKNKNQQLLIKSIARLKDRAPHIKLLLAGDGPLLNQCQRLVQFHRLEDKVDFLGLTYDIQRYLSISDVTIAASYREGLPVNIMEAMSSGLPVIAMENRGHKELVINNKNGWLFQKGNEEQLIDKILFLYNNREMIIELGINGRSIIKKNYSLKITVDELTKIYSKYIENKEGSHWAIQ